MNKNKSSHSKAQGPRNLNMSQKMMTMSALHSSAQNDNEGVSSKNIEELRETLNIGDDSSLADEMSGLDNDKHLNLHKVYDSLEVKERTETIIEPINIVNENAHK